MIRLLLSFVLMLVSAFPALPGEFNGKHYRGRGDVDYIQLLDTARRMFEPDPELENLSMFYQPQWNGLVLGPTWTFWWIQNSYGPSYCFLPFLEEPYVTFLGNSQKLWFDQMGDGKRAGCPSHPKINWVAPDGQLMDAAAPGCAIYKQGDGRTKIHDWGLEFTAAGVVMQAEYLLISRDRAALSHYLPLLERSANFLDTRRDPKNNLFLAGSAANLLAPSYAGWHRADGSYGKAYLAGLSVTYIAALDRLIELEKMAGAEDKVKLYSERRALARKGLPLLTTAEGYFIKSLDPDGARHGVYGAPEHGYFETVVNHDAICFRVVDRPQAERIYDKIASIPGLRPYSLIITNYPSLDDMYTEPKGLWRFGNWVNGGHWSTCEARMIMAYYRLGKYEDARRSMQKIMTFARRFRMDNNLTDFGNGLYQPKLPINLVYDTWGVPAALIRGLFEYLYTAEGLTLHPHIPPGITELEQLDPIRFGKKRIYLATAGVGPIRSVTVNGRLWRWFNETSIYLPESLTPPVARIAIGFGATPAPKLAMAVRPDSGQRSDTAADAGAVMKKLDAQAQRLREFRIRMARAGLAGRYESAHAGLAIRAIETIHARRKLLAEGKLARLPDASQQAADQLYLDTARKLCEGLDEVIAPYRNSTKRTQIQIRNIYISTMRTTGGG